MNKLYLFGIGGTGSRVIRSLTMLLASGVKLGNSIDTVIPIIIDPDKSNGDLTRTITLLKTYKTIHDNLKFGGNSKSLFFKQNIDDLQTAFRMEVANVEDKDFQTYIKYFDLDDKNKALVNLLFSKKNLEAKMDVGFKGNPNMGSIVLNNFDTDADNDLASILESFQDGDRIFIISSIFGGTGAAGFPLLLKTLRNAQALNLPSSANVASAPIGAISVLPYFGVNHDDESEINMDSFLSKTKSALSYYKDNLDTDVLYYISDKLSKNYDNNEGAEAQRNNAHFIELASALSIVDFCQNPCTHGEAKRYKEFGISQDDDPITLKSLSDSTKLILDKPLMSMFIFWKFLDNHLKNTFDMAWAKDFEYSDENGAVKGIDSSFLSQDFYVKLKKFMGCFKEEWLSEMASNSRGFNPFNLDTTGDNLYNSINGYTPKKSTIWGRILSKNLNGFDAIDNEVAVISNDLHRKLPLYDYFMDVHWQAINKVLKTKFDI